jgi:hypothetical protein
MGLNKKVESKRLRYSKCAKQKSRIAIYSGHQHVSDLAIYFLNGLSYDKKLTVNVIELGKTHLSVLHTLS